MAQHEPGQGVGPEEGRGPVIEHFNGIKRQAGILAHRCDGRGKQKRMRQDGQAALVVNAGEGVLRRFEVGNILFDADG